MKTVVVGGDLGPEFRQNPKGLGAGEGCALQTRLPKAAAIPLHRYRVHLDFSTASFNFHHRAGTRIDVVGQGPKHTSSPRERRGKALAGVP